MESNENKQLEMLKEFYGKVQERNINRARSSKPPADYEMVWSILRYTVQKGSGNPDKLMSGSCYGGANDDLASRFKVAKKDNDKHARKVAELEIEVKQLKEDLKIAKKGGKPGSAQKPKESGAAQKPAGLSIRAKADGCCQLFNRGEDCDKSCGKPHKCSWVDRSAVPARVCWATDHGKVNHPK